ncbi:MAG: ATP phosphoribosyltransferase [Clostridiales bacterium]|jgi:ATP phosphoribosyltransferase|nr:ATP phosphoribosyltransferase [Clostridiales bacterium]
MRYLTVALAKGRLADFSIEVFGNIGLDVASMREKTRKLIFTDEKNKLKFMLVKASDVPTYVEYGAADMGIVGKDTILEEGKNLYEVLDLKFGACKMCVCGYAEQPLPSGFIKVATKYPNIAREYFSAKKNQTIEVIKLSGSVELAPLCGLSEVIVDIVESGKTLKENGLAVLEEICGLSARLVVNRVSLKMEKRRIMDIVGKTKEILLNDNHH